MKKKISTYIGIFFVGLFVLIKNRKKVFGGLVWSNSSNLEIYYKPEEETEEERKKFPNGIARKLEAGKVPNERIDGLAIPDFAKNMVYKIPDGCHVNILENGRVEIIPECICDKFKWEGWQGESFHNYLLTNKDNSWNELFNKARGSK